MVLEDVIRASLDIVSSQVSHKQQALKYESDSTRPILRADRRAFTQMTLNLLSNAIKFTPEQGTITVSTHDSNMGGTTMCVVDNGVGIDGSMIPKVFEPFGQADNASA